MNDAVADPAKVHRFDGLLDVFKNVAASALAQLGLVGGDAHSEYARGGVAGIIVDRPAQDATSKGWRVELPNSGTDTKAFDELSRLRTQERMAEALRYCRLKGAAGILVFTEDSPDLAAPLNEANIGTIRGLVVYGADDIRAEPETYADPLFENYGEPIWYMLSPPKGQPFRVHESRLLRVAGLSFIRKRSTHSGPSWLGKEALDEATIGALMAYREGMRWAMRLMERKQQGVYKMKGMGDMMAMGDAGEALVRKRIALTDAGRNLLNSVVADADDDYTVLNLGVSGIQEVMVELKANLSACTSMPRSILFGESPTGLQATGRADLEFYYNFLAEIQKHSVFPALERLVTLIYAQKGMRQPAKWQVEFNPLWSLSEKEETEVDEAKARRLKTNAEGLVQINNLNVLDRDELRKATALMIPELEVDPSSPAPELEADPNDEPGLGNPGQQPPSPAA